MKILTKAGCLLIMLAVASLIDAKETTPSGRVVDVAARNQKARKSQLEDVAVQQADTDAIAAPNAKSDGLAQAGEEIASASVRFFRAFFTSVSMIIVSELGDKTFFIAAIMSMRNNRWEVFLSAMAALALMTVLSAAMGFTLPNFLPHTWTHYAAMVLFLFFGAKLLKSAWEMDPQGGGAKEELEEVESELAEKEGGEEGHAPEGLELGTIKKDKPRSSGVVKSGMAKFFGPVFIQCFTMTFLAEWGDRSQIATIALAAAQDPIGVTLGGIIGHALCTGLAVLGGKMLATRISERAVAFIGGLLFLVFAMHSYLAGPDST